MGLHPGRVLAADAGELPLLAYIQMRLHGQLKKFHDGSSASNNSWEYLS